jgi:hypothetical protein
MRAAAGYNAFKRGNVRIIPPPAHGDMLMRGKLVIGRVQVDPACSGIKYRKPGMRGIYAYQFFFTGWR